MYCSRFLFCHLSFGAVTRILVSADQMMGFKSGVTKLLAKLEETISIELECVHSESITESQRLTTITILAQLKT